MLQFTSTALRLTLFSVLIGFGILRAAHAQISLGTPEEVKGVGVDEHLEALLPLDEEYYDESGQKWPLRHFFREGRPVLISFNYSGCPKLCDAQLTGLVRTLRSMTLKPGEDFEYISMSINPEETPSRARESRNLYVARFGDMSTKNGWHFLTGSQDSIELITDTAGFRYKFLADRNEYVHAPIFIVCTPDGRISRYLYGVEIEPRTMRLSLVEAADGEIGKSMDQVILWCFNYDPDSNSYVLQAVNLMKIGGLATIVFIVAICVPFWFTRPRRWKTSTDKNAADQNDKSQEPTSVTRTE